MYHVIKANCCEKIGNLFLKQLQFKLTISWYFALNHCQKCHSEKKDIFFLKHTCSFDDLPDCCRSGWNHGSLVQTQFTNIHDMEAIHVLLWSDSVTNSPLVDMLWGGSINCYLQHLNHARSSSDSQVTPCATALTMFTRKWQLHQQAADPPVTVHLVNQLQQLFLGDRAWPHHCVTGNTCTARQMMHVRNTCVPFVDMCV